MTYGFPKPEPYKRVKDRRKRSETAVKTEQRALCVVRDGSCRFGSRAARKVLGDCSGASSWNHLLRRGQTVNQAAAVRHSAATSCIQCREHHRQVDEHEVTFEYLTDRQANGPMRWTKDGQVYEETSR